MFVMAKMFRPESRVSAGAKRGLVAMDGLYRLGFGPRTPETAGELMRAVYPDLTRG